MNLKIVEKTWLGLSCQILAEVKPLFWACPIGLGFSEVSGFCSCSCYCCCFCRCCPCCCCYYHAKVKSTPSNALTPGMWQKAWLNGLEEKRVKLRGAVKKKKTVYLKTLSKKEGRRSTPFQKIETEWFLDKIWRRRGSQNILSNIEALYFVWFITQSGQPRDSVSFCNRDNR